MPRRDVILTGMIAFAAGCAVGANWPKIRKKIGPMIGKAGFQISELGEFLSESFPDAESFFNGGARGRATNPLAKKKTSSPRPGASMNGGYRNGTAHATTRSTKSSAPAAPVSAQKSPRRRKKSVSV